MRILILNWRDIKNPDAGGAEIYTHEVSKRLVKNGNNVTIFCSLYPYAKSREVINNVEIIRQGKSWTVQLYAYKWYKKNSEKFDLIIDQINTIPFFTPLYIKNKNKFAFFHQLCRNVWWYETIFPFNLIGYLLEPLYLKIYKNIPVITVSESTKRDLIKYGHKKENISICPEGLNFQFLNKLPIKEKNPTIIFVGRLTSSKRPEDAILSFFLVSQKFPKANLWIIGQGKRTYKEKLMKLVKKFNLTEKVKFYGFVSQKKKLDLMKRAHILIVTSVKEGWGLIVTEAAACGTPSVVYNVDGLRDSVKNNKTGIICDVNSPGDLSNKVIKLLSNKEEYKRLQINAWQWSKEFSWDKTTYEFERIIKSL